LLKLEILCPNKVTSHGLGIRLFRGPPLNQLHGGYEVEKDRVLFLKELNVVEKTNN
jgi:hypothetical protein